MSRLAWINPKVWLRRLRSWWEYRPGGPRARSAPTIPRAEVGETAEEALDTLRALGYSFVYVPDKRNPERIAAFKRKGIPFSPVTDVAMIMGQTYAYGMRLELGHHMDDPFDTTNVREVRFAVAGSPAVVMAGIEGIGPADQPHSAGLAMAPGPLDGGETAMLESFNVKTKQLFVPLTGWASPPPKDRRS